MTRKTIAPSRSSMSRISPTRVGVSCRSDKRIVTASIVIAALSLGPPAFVQAQGAPPEPPAQSSTVIRSIQVVDVKDLQPAVRSKVDELVAATREEDIQSLRKSIDATPEAAAVLKAKGLNSAQIVAINIADGVLTMFAKTA